MKDIWRSTVCAMLLMVVLVALVAEAQNMNGPPERPKVFRNPEELRDYLKSLNEYFAIVGRPRFGKRSPFKRAGFPYGQLDLNEQETGW